MRRTALLTLAAAWALAAAATLTGCGGGGSVSRGSVAVYVMDGFDDSYSQVWATVQKVEISADGSSYQTLVDSSDGLEVNLPDLVDSAELIGVADVPAGAYTKLRVMLRDRMRTVARDGAVAERQLHMGAANGFAAGTNGQCTVTIPIALQVRQGGTADLPIDFDLARFQMVGDAISAQVGQANAERFRARERKVRLHGRVTNLDTASGFDLALVNGRTVRVLLATTTSIVSASTGAEVALAEGQRVLVLGTWDVPKQAVAASVIVVLDSSPTAPTPAHVRGVVTKVSEAENWFLVEPHNAFMSFRPQAVTVTVKVDASTVFGFVPRSPATFADVKVGANVDVLGTFDKTADAIAARRVLIGR